MVEAGDSLVDEGVALGVGEGCCVEEVAVGVFEDLGFGEGVEAVHAEGVCTDAVVAGDEGGHCLPAGETASTSAAATKTASNGTLTWALKDSFIAYIKGTIAQGSISVEGDGLTHANNTFSWTGATGEFSGTRGAITYPGTIAATGHKGTLDMTIQNPRLAISNNVGTLYATVASNDTEGNPKNYGEVAFATVDLSGLSTANGPLEITEQLRSAGVTVVHFDPARSMDQVVPQIHKVAEALGVPESGTALAERVQAEIDSALETIAQVAPS